jgi:hypothetical protein
VVAARAAAAILRETIIWNESRLRRHFQRGGRSIHGGICMVNSNQITVKNPPRRGAPGGRFEPARPAW